MKHKHNWQFSKIFMPDDWDKLAWKSVPEALFVCECGAMKRVRLTEVKE